MVAVSEPVASHHLSANPNVLSETKIGGGGSSTLSYGPVVASDESAVDSGVKEEPRLIIQSAENPAESKPIELTEPSAKPATQDIPTTAAGSARVSLFSNVLGKFKGFVGSFASEIKPQLSTADSTISPDSLPRAANEDASELDSVSTEKESLTVTEVPIPEVLEDEMIETPSVTATEGSESSVIDSIGGTASAQDSGGVSGEYQTQLISLEEARKEILNTVMGHPEVIGQQNALILAGWRVKETESQSSPKLSFNTTGKYPIADNVDDSRLRADNLDRSYIDGTIQLSKPFFDAGKRRFLEGASSQRRSVERLRYLETFGEQLARFLTLLLEQRRHNFEIQSVTSDLAFIDRSIETVRRRYELGAGTLNDVRILELRRLDLERLLDSAQRQAKLGSEVLVSEFGLTDPDPVWLLDIVSPLDADGVVLELEVLDSLRNRISQLEQVALEMQRQSVKAERFPEVSLTVNGVLYDLAERPLDEYELYGGLSMTLPLFDGGERDAKIEGIEVQKTIEQSTLRKSLADLQSSWDETEAQLAELQTQKLSNESRLASLLERLDELKIRAKTIESGLIEVSQTELERRSVSRELALGELTSLVVTVSRAGLAGRLMRIVNIEPVIE